MRKFTFFFGIGTCLLGIACAILEWSMAMRILIAVLVLITVHLELKYAKCSHCKELGVNLNPFSKRFGICKYCDHREE